MYGVQADILYKRRDRITQTHNKGRRMKINIEKIRIDGDTQSRVKIHENIVQEYTESLLNKVQAIHNHGSKSMKTLFKSTQKAF